MGIIGQPLSDRPAALSGQLLCILAIGWPLGGQPLKRLTIYYWSTSKIADLLLMADCLNRTVQAGQTLLWINFICAYHCLRYLDTTEHCFLHWTNDPHAARLQPLYTIWSRDQITASRMFTSVTIATYTIWSCDQITASWMFTSVTIATSIRRTLNIKNITLLNNFHAVEIN